MTDPSTAPDAARFESLAPASTAPKESAGSRAGSAIALLGLLVGLPAALVALGGAPPIPTRLPSLRELAQQLGPADLVTVLVAIVWLLWLVFVGCVVLEIIAARRGGLARTVPFAGPLQHLARVLIGGLLVTGLAVGPAGAATGPSAEIAPPSGPVAAAVVGAAESAEAVARAEVASAADQVGDRLDGELVYTVKAPKDGYHDNLWDIAERHLGDGFRYQEIYELNKDRTQLDGRKLELARLIHPGWQLVMPADAVGVDRVPEQQTPAPATSAAAEADAAADSNTAADAAPASEGVAWWMGAGLLAAGLLAALAARRRRRPGGEPPGDAREIEAELRLAADPGRAQGLDAVLRELTVACRDTGVQPPSAYMAVVDSDEVLLHVAPAAPVAVAGWEALEDGAVWRRAGEVAAARAPQEAEPALPSLVSLGVDDHGRDVLIDLASSGGLITVSGDLHVSSEMVTSLALQAAVSPWSRDVRVVAAGLPASLADLTDRLVLITEADAAADELASGRDVDILTGRQREDELAVVVAGAPLSASAAERLAALAATRPGTAVVAVGEHEAARWRLYADEHGGVRVPQLGLTLVANRIGARHAEAVAALFAVAQEPLDAPDPTDRVAVTAPQRDADDGAWLTATCRVGVLGPVLVEGGGEPDERRVAVLAEIVAFVAMHPEGVHPTVLAGAVWPLGVAGEVRDANIERARAWLGTDRDGAHRLRESLDGRLTLGPDVVCDWDVLRRLVIDSRQARLAREEIDLLRRALKLVRGPAFADVPRGRYAWTAPMDLPRTMGELVVDAGLRLATLLHDDGDPAGAAAAAGAILRMHPTHDEAWRIILRARHRSGSSAVATAVAELEAALAGEPMDPTTATLVDELLPDRGAIA